MRSIRPYEEVKKEFMEALEAVRLAEEEFKKIRTT